MASSSSLISISVPSFSVPALQALCAQLLVEKEKEKGQLPDDAKMLNQMIASFNAWARECEQRLLRLKLIQNPQLLLPQGQRQGPETVKTTNDEQTGAAAAAVTTLIPRKTVKYNHKNKQKLRFQQKQKQRTLLLVIKVS